MSSPLFLFCYCFQIWKNCSLYWSKHLFPLLKEIKSWKLISCWRGDFAFNLRRIYRLHQEKPRKYRVCLQQYLLPCLWLRGGRRTLLKRLWTIPASKSQAGVSGSSSFTGTVWYCKGREWRNCRAEIQIHKRISGRFWAVRNVSGSVKTLGEQSGGLCIMRVHTVWLFLWKPGKTSLLTVRDYILFAKDDTWGIILPPFLVTITEDLESQKLWHS